MTAATPLRQAGFALTLGADGAVLIAPRAKPNESVRAYVRVHLHALRRELQAEQQEQSEPEETHPTCRGWRINFIDGTGCCAINVTGATQDEMLHIARETFGGRVVNVSKIRIED